MPSNNQLSDFKSNFNGGTRKNRFLIDADFPGGSFTRFHIVSTNIPSTSSKQIEYNYFGRVWKFPGEKDYGTWSFVVTDDVGNDVANLWKQFQSWQNLINNHETNESSTSALSYKTNTLKIKHLNINGDEDQPLKTYILEGCWPSSIRGINFNMGINNQLNRFVVTMHFDSISIGGISVGPEGTGIASRI
jgi:hypothetical protein